MQRAADSDAQPVAAETGAAADAIRRFDERVERGQLELPLLPGAAAEILAATRDPQGELERLAGLIQRDPALAAHVLRLANSSLYAAAVEISSLQQAVARLGLRALAELALAVALRTRVFALPGREAEIEGIFRHCALTAGWAREVARARRKSTDGAFLCGLLHDVGRPIGIDALAALERQASVRLEPSSFERAVARRHAELGGRLLLAWKLPEWMVAAVAFHHQPLQADAHRDQALSVCLADLLAHWSDEPTPAATEHVRHHPVLRHLAIYAEDLEALFGRRAAVLQAAQALR